MKLLIKWKNRLVLCCKQLRNLKRMFRKRMNNWHNFRKISKMKSNSLKGKLNNLKKKITSCLIKLSNSLRTWQSWPSNENLFKVLNLELKQIWELRKCLKRKSMWENLRKKLEFTNSIILEAHLALSQPLDSWLESSCLMQLRKFIQRSSSMMRYVEKVNLL